MQAVGIRPTITHLVRDFLFQQNAQIKPWTTLDETYAALYDLLRERREDPKFWGPLANLLQSIVDNTMDAKGQSKHSISYAELLTSWDVDELLGFLRQALPEAHRESSCEEVKQFCTGLSAPVLTGFLLLGLALSGCEHHPSDEWIPEPEATNLYGSQDSGLVEPKSLVDSASPVQPIETEAINKTEFETDSNVEPTVPEWHTGCSLQHSSIIFDAIDKSVLEDGEKSVLCECLASIHVSWRPSLEAVFRYDTPARIAAVLESMLNCCEQSPEELKNRYGGTMADLVSIASRGCNVVEDFANVPIYKGVSFKK